MKVDFTNGGAPCLWERGGGCSNTGYAVLICSPDGTPKVPIYVRRSGELSNGDHAKIPVEPGDLVVMASHHRRDFTVLISRYEGYTQREEASLTAINSYSEGQWETPLDPRLKDVVEAAKEKATDYHCREAYYIASGTN